MGSFPETSIDLKLWIRQPSGPSCLKSGLRYPMDSAIGYRTTYPLDSDLSGG